MTNPSIFLANYQSQLIVARTNRSIAKQKHERIISAEYPVAYLVYRTSADIRIADQEIAELNNKIEKIKEIHSL